ncbi:MRN complex-interacting protein-like [Gigantopelta aegis]|uniref:MRN complex-interacting protein-like n=1 Tax=Gigantopelta aegis TaxID=1735272 RepID=UPI001B88B608|nr:MRN complex-interacting protein-like [Gigantopelta aegis]
MPQVFQVLQCYSCQMFQVQQAKKSNKWTCKMCGEKQSIKKVFGEGSGAECRQHVQEMNRLYGEQQSQQLHQCVAPETSSTGFDSQPRSTVQQQQIGNASRWSSYIDEPASGLTDEEDCDDYFTVDKHDTKQRNKRHELKLNTVRTGLCSSYRKRSQPDDSQNMPSSTDGRQTYKRLPVFGHGNYHTEYSGCLNLSDQRMQNTERLNRKRTRVDLNHTESSCFNDDNIGLQSGILLVDSMKTGSKDRLLAEYEECPDMGILLENEDKPDTISLNINRTSVKIRQKNNFSDTPKVVSSSKWSVFIDTVDSNQSDSSDDSQHSSFPEMLQLRAKTSSFKENGEKPFREDSMVSSEDLDIPNNEGKTIEESSKQIEDSKKYFTKYKVRMDSVSDTFGIFLSDENKVNKKSSPGNKLMELCDKIDDATQCDNDVVGNMFNIGDLSEEDFELNM